MRCVLQFPGAAAAAAPAVRYSEVEPPPDLRRAVACFWSLEVAAGSGGFLQRMLPDLSVDLIALADGVRIAIGPMLRATDVPIPAGAVLRGVRLRAGIAARLLGVPAKDLVGRRHRLDGVAPDLDLRLRSGPEGFHAAVAQALRGREIAPCEGMDLHTSLRWLAANPTTVVDQLSARLGVSARYVRRHLASELGCSPKTAQRILRVQRVLRMARATCGQAALADVAERCGFADQPHLSRELRHFMRLTPGRLMTMARAGG